VKTRVALYEEPNERLIVRTAGSPTAFMVGLMPLALPAARGRCVLDETLERIQKAITRHPNELNRQLLALGATVR
jgi:hypothetical protein